MQEGSRGLKALKGEGSYFPGLSDRPGRVPGEYKERLHPSRPALLSPGPYTHPHTALSSAAASRLQPRSRATAISSGSESATPWLPGAGGSLSDKSPAPRSRPRHSSPKAPTWKARVLSSGSSYSGKLEPTTRGTRSCLSPTPPHEGPPRLPSAMSAALPFRRSQQTDLAQRDGTCSCAWRTGGGRGAWRAGPGTLHFPAGPAVGWARLGRSEGRVGRIVLRDRAGERSAAPGQLRRALLGAGTHLPMAPCPAVSVLPSVGPGSGA
jgi:hypothetical protein